MTQLPTSIYPILRQLAARSGIPMGTLWLLSFALVIISINEPAFGLFGNLCAFYTVIYGIRLVRRLRGAVQGLAFVKCLYYIWLTCLFATLLTTFGQYIYFAFLDNGRFVQGFIRIMQDPLYAESFQQFYPEGFDMDKMVELVSSLTVRDIVAQLLVTNLFCSAVVAIPAAVIGSIGKVPPRYPQDQANPT